VCWGRLLRMFNLRQHLCLSSRMAPSSWTRSRSSSESTLSFARAGRDGESSPREHVAHRWLDKTYPDRPSLYLPEAAPPIDVDSAAYRSAVEDFEAWRDCKSLSCSPPSRFC